MSEVIYVKALYAFKGSNNDELIFKQGDIITITQLGEDGWSEGTFNGKTGWFPSNYVKQIKADQLADGLVSQASSPKCQQYRNEVLKGMIESEEAHVNALSASFKSYLQPLYKSNILEESEVQQLIGNYEQVIAIHTQLLHNLQQTLGFIGKEQRVGSMLMQMASDVKKVHVSYCANHPKAVQLISEHKQALTKYMESVDASSGTMTLTTVLSKPFKRLEKYQVLLQELERHTDEGHVDRGDCQRALAVYNDIAVCANAIRRQKEMELDVMAEGRIREWQGQPITSFGPIIHLSQVIIHQSQSKQDRYIVLFSHAIVVLSVSHRLSAFIYEATLLLNGLTVVNDLNISNAFQINQPTLTMTVECQTKSDRDMWLELIDKHQQPNNSSGNSTPHNNPLIPPHRSPTPPSISSIVSEPYQQSSLSSVWSMSCLRPSPPLRSCINNAKKGEANKKKEEKWYEDDMKILRVIEAYCTSAKARNTLNSTLLDCRQLLTADDHNQTTAALAAAAQETKPKENVMELRSLVDTVFALKDQLDALSLQTSNLCATFEDERKARLKLEAFVRKNFLNSQQDLAWHD